jgi:hypothetical protein
MATGAGSNHPPPGGAALCSPCVDVGNGPRMAQASCEVAAPTDQVWAVLSDGWSYPTWVVGTVKMRAVDAAWPSVGCRLHHAVGAWPLTIEDDTEVLECQPGVRLRLQARGWPLGEATVDLTLRPAGDRCVVDMVETPSRGPARWLHNKVLDAVLARRLDETLDRLRRLAEREEGRGQ